MARAANQKLKILYILKLLEQSDENHVVTMKDILGELADHGIQAERKRIYDDLDALRRFGYPIAAKRGRTAGYYLAEGGEDILREGVSGRAGRAFPEAEEKAGSEMAGIETRMDSEPEEDQKGVPEWLLFGNTKVELAGDEEAMEHILKEFGGTGRIRMKAGKRMGNAALKLRIEPGEAFYGWLAGFGCHVRLFGSPAVIKEYRRYLKEIRTMYKEE